ncbi:MAG: hypothetical protein WCF33_13040 [Pseudonocardiaceae bacterium]
MVTTRTDWRELIVEVPRDLVGANEPVITQVDEDHIAAGGTGRSLSSSCSKPSIMADMLEWRRPQRPGT